MHKSINLTLNSKYINGYPLLEKVMVGFSLLNKMSLQSLSQF
jgi:hypothetical protein